MAAERALDQVGKLKDESIALFVRAMENLNQDLCANLGALKETFMKGCRDAESVKMEVAKIQEATSAATPI